jgi:UDP-GlcNAc3NAcA epimerase
MKIITIIGARPQFIKASMLSRQFRNSNIIKEIIINTNQHFDENMSSVFFNEMLIPEPKYNLGIASLSHGAMTGRQIEAIEVVLIKEKPNFVLVYGDTNSTLAGALASSKLNIPLIHVEAGLRSFNKKMPEEINRVLTDHMSDLLFTPSDVANKNLYNEGISKSKIKMVGDIMYDAALFFGKIAEKKSSILDRLGLNSSSYLLATIHRAENTDNEGKLRSVFKGFQNSPLPVYIPLHPRTRSKIKKYNIPTSGSINIIEPLGFLDMLQLEKNATKILTDSGGVQKEAFYFQVPCITIRDQTEWVELIKNKSNVLVGPNADQIIENISKKTPKTFNETIYGGGNASSKIKKIIEKR